MSTMSADQLNSFLEKLDILCAKLKEEDCPICDLRLTGDKTFCINKHGICNSCKLVVTICPVCSANYPGNVQTGAEEQSVATNGIQVEENDSPDGNRRCVNSSRGCQTRLPASDIRDHELTCTFRSYVCKICSVEMCLRKLKGHCERSHRQDILKNSVFHFVRDDETQNGSKYYYVEAHDQIFWFWRNITDRLVFSGLQLCNSNDSSGEFKYTLEVTSKDQKCVSKFGGPVLFDTTEPPRYGPSEDFVMFAKNMFSSGSKLKITITIV